MHRGHTAPPPRRRRLSDATFEIVWFLLWAAFGIILLAAVLRQLGWL